MAVYISDMEHYHKLCNILLPGAAVTSIQMAAKAKPAVAVTTVVISDTSSRNSIDSSGKADSRPDSAGTAPDVKTGRGITYPTGKVLVFCR